MIWDLASCVPPQPLGVVYAGDLLQLPGRHVRPAGRRVRRAHRQLRELPDRSDLRRRRVSAAVCGAPDGGTCTPQTCATYPSRHLRPAERRLRRADDQLHNCPRRQSCGGSGAAGVCGTGRAATCTPAHLRAYPPGPAASRADGCGGLTADCNPCPTGQTCGGGGTPGQCCTPPSNMCTPTDVPATPAAAAPRPTAAAASPRAAARARRPQTCGGGGVAGQCGGNGGCTPQPARRRESPAVRRPTGAAT